VQYPVSQRLLYTLLNERQHKELLCITFWVTFRRILEFLGISMSRQRLPNMDVRHVPLRQDVELEQCRVQYHNVTEIPRNSYVRMSRHTECNISTICYASVLKMYITFNLTQDMHTSDNLYASVKNKSALNSNLIKFARTRYLAGNG